MPTKPRREDALITLFLSAHEDDRWAVSKIDWLAQQRDGAVEAIATRPDGQTLAIEHTLIEFFMGERTELERFKPFRRIESDPSLSVTGRIIYVDVPPGVLDGLKPKAQERPASGVAKPCLFCGAEGLGVLCVTRQAEDPPSLQRVGLGAPSLTSFAWTPLQSHSARSDREDRTFR